MPATTQAPKRGFDDAATISAFLSMISPAAQPRLPSSSPEHVAKQAIEQTLSNEQDGDQSVPKGPAPGPTAVMGAMESTASKMPAEDGSDGVNMNGPKNPLVTAVQAQGSPQVSGVRAPPPTPETVSNLAIGRLFMDVLEDIPQDRVLSLGDSIHAPKNYSKLRYNRSTAADQSPSQFFSPVPRSSKPREDASYSRMSFKAAETLSPPGFSLPSIEIKSGTNLQNTFQAQAPGTLPTETTRISKSINNAAEQFTNPDMRVHEQNVTTASTVGTSSSKVPKTPPPPPRLEPFAAKQIQAAKVSTPDVPDRPLETVVGWIPSPEAPIQTRYAQANPFPADRSPRPVQENEKAKENQEPRRLAVPKSLANVTAGSLEAGTPPRVPLQPAGGLLTPASMTFGAVSPQSVKAAGIKAASKPGEANGQNLEDAIFFKAWPKVEGRGTRTAAKVRKVMLTGSPSGATPSLVASFVFGGPLERIHVGDSSAFVTFLRGEDAEKYYETTENGLEYEKDGVKRVIMTEMTSEVNPVSGKLREYVEKEFTRCMRSVNFRFCDISDAVQFKQTLSRSEDWEECNIHFAPDPCATATDMHFD
ncbi:MAG: hypothetical protein Q9168_001171 [Polycauliona sp. 1 TL-2023]